MNKFYIIVLCNPPKKGEHMIHIKLAEKLAEKKWTQAQLARKTGIRPNTISDLYNEKASAITFYNLEKICTVLECSIEDFIEIKR